MGGLTKGPANTDPSLTGDEGNPRAEEIKQFVDDLTPEDLQLLQTILEEKLQEETPEDQKDDSDESGGNSNMMDVTKEP
jgi:hypothetical protein